jgi:hypothetical protein
MYQRFLGSEKCADFRQTSATARSGGGAGGSGNGGEVAVVATPPPDPADMCTTAWKSVPTSRLGTYLANEHGVEGARVRCWTCGGYNDLVYTLTKGECDRVIAPLRIALGSSTELSCHASYLYGRKAYLISFAAGCTSKEADALDGALPHEVLERDCSGHGDVNANGECVCRAGFVGKTCETSIFSSIS